MNQKSDEKSPVPFVKSVLDFQNRIKFYEKVIFFVCLANIVFGAIVFDSIFKSPLVIMEKDGEKLSYRSSAKDIVITEEEIKKLVENFIKRRFEWDKFSVDVVMKNLSPILSGGLKSKLEEDLVKEEKANKNQSFSQYVGKVNIAIDSDNNIIGSFDKILRIHTNANGDSDLPEKIPLLAEAQVMVKVVKGLITYENPLGLYINSVINYEPR